MKINNIGNCLLGWKFPHPFLIRTPKAISWQGSVVIRSQVSIYHTLPEIQYYFRLKEFRKQQQLFAQQIGELAQLGVYTSTTLS